MVLAEALLRVPDADTADRLIEDKLKAGDRRIMGRARPRFWCRRRRGRWALPPVSSIPEKRRKELSKH